MFDVVMIIFFKFLVWFNFGVYFVLSVKGVVIVRFEYFFWVISGYGDVLSLIVFLVFCKFFKLKVYSSSFGFELSLVFVGLVLGIVRN